MCQIKRSYSSPVGRAGLQSLCENPVLHVIPRSHRRRGISHCQENPQGKIPRFARNDSLNEVFTQTLQPRPSRSGGLSRIPISGDEIPKLLVGPDPQIGNCQEEPLPRQLAKDFRQLFKAVVNVQDQARLLQRLL